MRVALVILHDDPARGGAERYTADLAAGLVGRGHEVAIVSARDDARVGPAVVGGGVRRVRLIAESLTRAGRYAALMRSLEDHLAASGYDIVHAMLPVPGCDVYHPHAGIAADAAEKTGWRLVFNPRRAKFAAVERRLLKSPRPPVVLSLSRYIQKTLERHYPALPEQAKFVLPNGVDLEHFSPGRDVAETRPAVGLPNDGPVLLIVAQDFERKGLREAIEALAASRHRTAKLVVVGRPNPAAYRRRAIELGVGDRVIFVGPQGEPLPYYHAADAFILPTRHDPCSLVVLEALACGVPTISTTRNGACELMADGVHGRVLSDPADVGALASAIDEVLDPAVLPRMRQACIALRPTISQAHHLDLLEGLYGRIVAERAAKGR